MKRVQAITAILAGAYLAGAFIAWDFNPEDWSEMGRMLAALTAGWAIFMSFLFSKRPL